MNGSVYSIHFERPISDVNHCRHYLGWAKDLESRIAQHKAGTGARLCQVAIEQGINFDVVRTWQGDRKLERKLKNLKNSPRLCPICSGETSHE